MKLCFLYNRKPATLEMMAKKTLRGIKNKLCRDLIVLSTESSTILVGLVINVIYNKADSKGLTSLF